MELHERIGYSGLAQAEGIIQEIQERIPFKLKFQSQDAFLVYAFLQGRENPGSPEAPDSILTKKFREASDTQISLEHSVPLRLNYQEVGMVGYFLIADTPDADPKQRKFQRLKAELYQRLAGSFVAGGGQDNSIHRERLQKLIK